MDKVGLVLEICVCFGGWCSTVEAAGLGWARLGWENWNEVSPEFF